MGAAAEGRDDPARLRDVTGFAQNLTDLLDLFAKVFQDLVFGNDVDMNAFRAQLPRLRVVDHEPESLGLLFRCACHLRQTLAEILRRQRITGDITARRVYLVVLRELAALHKQHMRPIIRTFEHRQERVVRITGNVFDAIFQILVPKQLHVIPHREAAVGQLLTANFFCAVHDCVVLELLDPHHLFFRRALFGDFFRGHGRFGR